MILRHQWKKNLAILRTRVDELGVSQPIIQRQGKDRIIVQLPGLQDSTRAKNILGSTATLEFRLTKGTPDDWIASDTIGTNTVSESVLYRQKGGAPILLSRDVASGKDIEGANSGFDSQTNQPAVFVNLSSYGASSMLETTSKNIGNRMAVVFVEQDKNQVINVATIREAFSKRFQITGMILKKLKTAILLRSGSLSAPMSIVEERTVGPSLGSENIISGRDSMILGMILVVIFMFIYYKKFGLVANLALIANIFIIITATLSLFQATLTLSGIAGIVLTVGMAVDANVLIYERIREEILNGNSPNASIISGYNKAFSNYFRC